MMPKNCEKRTIKSRACVPLMHRVCILCVKCALICYIPDSCDCEPYLTVSIFFRRINHMAVKNHLHSSSGVQEVVSGTGHISMKNRYFYADLTNLNTPY